MYEVTATIEGVDTAELNCFAATLNNRDRDIFERRWLNTVIQSRRALSQQYDLSEHRIATIERNAVAKLRSYLETKLDKSVIIRCIESKKQRSSHRTLQIDLSAKLTPPQETLLFSDAKLTLREQQVAALIATGLTNKLIGVRLNITEHTVHFHILNIFKKLHVANRAAIAAYAVKFGLAV